VKRTLYDFDVIVVGGGCAGLWAAICAADEGASTLVLEKARRIGDRIVCAEGVGARGLSTIIEISEAWVATTIDRARLFDPEGRCYEIPQAGCGYILKKDAFLQALAEIAARRGVSIRTSALGMLASVGNDHITLEVRSDGGREEVTARAVVAADGIRSEISRQAGILGNLKVNEVFSCAQDTVTGIKVDPHLVEFHFGSRIAPGGYAWVFPKGSGKANVGVGIVSDGGSTECAGHYLAKFKINRCPESSIEKPIVGGVPSLSNPFNGCGKGIFAAGDAARVADPISGAGIVRALESGAIAGKVAAGYATSRLSLKAAEEMYRKELKHLWRDRVLRFMIRKIMMRMSDDDLCRLVARTADFFAGGNRLEQDPIKLVKFLIRAMPDAFALVRHLVRV